MINLLKDAAIEETSEKELEVLLENRDIDAVYAHLLGRSADAIRAKKLHQLVLAATQPLTLDELNVALSVSPLHLSFKELNSNLKYPIENHVKTVCGYSIRIIRNKVYLIYQTAREFLLRQNFGLVTTKIRVKKFLMRS